MQSGFTTASVNLRGGPGVDHQVVDKLEPDFPLTIHEVKNGWCRVTAHALGRRTRAQDGWIDSRFVARERTPQNPPPLDFDKGHLLRAPEWRFVVVAAAAALIAGGVLVWLLI